ncbi:DUF3795 domain-containing protein [Clostridium sp. D33t1_170424_F3]|uniref:DUF3795 domain-containing protein n=1 Tax=Clostridium sp. D33t1_170424_F3 TaxID=2787099 RepID=UPI0018ABD10E|nr:DUF3795 domain-containing protein [Clostridium sp. D33t1_170424_F3]MDC0700620.1 DUF3795 domain-containing protein [Blautia wexlerae]
MKRETIAPCGMNCALCAVYQREKKNCPGCRAGSAGKPGHCRSCAIKSCSVMRTEGGRCETCPDFPCERLKRLDRRYRKQYHVSLLENLRMIQAEGMDAFLREEDARWTCSACGERLCMHETTCPSCGKERK